MYFLTEKIKTKILITTIRITLFNYNNQIKPTKEKQQNLWMHINDMGDFI